MLATKDYVAQAVKVLRNGTNIAVINANECGNIVLLTAEEYRRYSLAENNAAYLDKIEESLQQIEEGKVFTYTIEELEEMAK